MVRVREPKTLSLDAVQFARAESICAYIVLPNGVRFSATIPLPPIPLPSIIHFPAVRATNTRRVRTRSDARGASRRTRQGRGMGAGESSRKRDRMNKLSAAMSRCHSAFSCKPLEGERPASRFLQIEIERKPADAEGPPNSFEKLEGERPASRFCNVQSERNWKNAFTRKRGAFSCREPDATTRPRAGGAMIIPRLATQRIRPECSRG